MLDAADIADDSRPITEELFITLTISVSQTLMQMWFLGEATNSLTSQNAENLILPPIYRR
jgi:hypothetical protein